VYAVALGKASAHGIASGAKFVFKYVKDKKIAAKKEKTKVDTPNLSCCFL
jgi:hypothetical protein